MSAQRRHPILRVLLCLGVGAVVLLLSALVLLRNPDHLDIDNPRFSQGLPPLEDRPMPRFIRYRSALEAWYGKACYGLVVETDRGVPVQVLNLTALDPTLGSTFGAFLAGDGFALADQLFAAEGWENRPMLVESLSEENLADAILPPVDITGSQLDSEERFVVGVGFNYQAHREEAEGAAADQFLFAKAVEPTGAYAPLSLGPSALPLAGPARLVDYEVEIGFVLLEDVDLLMLDSIDEASLNQRIAFFIANDVTNRWPIIRDGDPGYTIAKSRPTYLPTGPWLVHGRHLRPKTASGGEEALHLTLRVEEAEPHPSGSWRQAASSADMIRGPLQILRMAAAIYSRSSREDASGVERHIARRETGGLILPAGSLVLTGTPEGTAIEAPGDLDRLRLLFLGNFLPRRAKLAFALHCVRQRRQMGFLHQGDVVETRVEHLGRQRWRVGP